ncbi:hypothetical protein Poli38472_009169 [Pythium oligandrum]|uniref:Capsule synthesis protein CapA domain-containing protein n=1 Tax=Pythium oligandrum TaxID=41045 RepID=A0A8K1CK89_PYTOL|nr:hypothetical protein Poli38472_009169 [Pythium oligandrum]|eukprot:TMW65002.1 hypothetical protein Poli38472_009169 [Pythium oligandrum]
MRLLLHGGDTMLGRAVQLTFPHQAVGEEVLTDSTTAWNYLLLAMHSLRCKGTLVPMNMDELQAIRQQNRDGSYLWGEFFHRLVILPPPDVRILNLETAVTEKIDNADIPHKGINYHFHAMNIPLAFKSFSAAVFAPVGSHTLPSPYVISLANNHVLDFGRQAFENETLEAIRRLPGDAHIVGAGLSFDQAARAAQIRLAHNNRAVSVIAVTTECAGTPYDWNATAKRSGMICLPAILSAHSVDRAMNQITEILRMNGLLPPRHPEEDFVVLSVHWGPNWAYRYRDDLDYQRYRQQLAHRIVHELGVELIYGHSSHHIRGLEIFEGKLIIYGAGDLVNDYEGFENPGDEAYNKLGALFLVDLYPATGNLQTLRLVPTVMDRLQLKQVTSDTLTMHWCPQHQCMKPIVNPISGLRDAVNKLSSMDVGCHGEAVELRMVENDDAVPDATILRYP